MFRDLSLWVQIRTWRTIFVIGWLLSWSGKCWQLVGNRKRTALSIKSNVLLTDPFTWTLCFMALSGELTFFFPETSDAVIFPERAIKGHENMKGLCGCFSKLTYSSSQNGAHAFTTQVTWYAFNWNAPSIHALMKRELISSKGRLLDSILAALYEIGVELHHYSHSSRVNTQLSLHRTVPQGQNQNCQRASSFFRFYMNASWCCVDVVWWLNVVVRKQVWKCHIMTIIICRLLFYILQQKDIQ